MAKSEPAATRAATDDQALKGLAAAPGIAIGSVWLMPTDDPVVEDRPLAESEVAGEIVHFRSAVEHTRLDLLALRESLAAVVGETHAKIFDAHLALLDDVAAIDATVDAIRVEQRNASAIFRRVTADLASKLAHMENEYLRQRAADVEDVARRVLRHLTQEPGTGNRLTEPPDNAIVVARDIPPSDAAMIVRHAVAGFAMEGGGRTSHTALLAQERGIPAVVGVRNLGQYARMGMRAIVDGTRGLILLDPSDADVRYYARKQQLFQNFQKRLEETREGPAVTQDGHTVGLTGNVSSAAEVGQVLERGAEGIGLYRTEYLFLTRAVLPSEEEQFAAYDAVAQALAPRPVILRTLDVGGDKIVPGLEPLRQRNPVLGVRGIRVYADHVDTFRTQIRAMLRASRHGNVKIMFPMITRVEEMRWATDILREEAHALERGGATIDARVDVGAMIETPAAVWLAPALADMCDFFSIGSNDLTQYMLAVDRGNEHVASLYDPLHPAVLLAIRYAITAARSRSIWAGICGEMAVDPVALALLVGCGVDEISTSAVAIPKLKALIRALTFAEVQEMTAQALTLSTAEDIRAFVTAHLQRSLPEMFA